MHKIIITAMVRAFPQLLYHRMPNTRLWGIEKMSLTNIIQRWNALVLRYGFEIVLIEKFILHIDFWEKHIDLIGGNHSYL